MADLRQRLQREAEELLSDAFADSSMETSVENLVASLIDDLPSEKIETYLSDYFHVHGKCKFCGEETLEYYMTADGEQALYCYDVDCEGDLS